MIYTGTTDEAVKGTQQEGDVVGETIAKRGEIYGDPRESHNNIGLSWTALIQQHFEIELPHPIPASLVAQMMVVFKMQRAARVFHRDNYIDAQAYARFAEEFQKDSKT